MKQVPWNPPAPLCANEANKTLGLINIDLSMDSTLSSRAHSLG